MEAATVRPLSVLLLLACSVIVASQARAETVSTRLTREKTGDHLRSFTVKAERLTETGATGAGKVLEFHVTTKPKPGRGPGLPRRSGTLEIFDGKKLVSSCEVRATERDGQVTFTFRVAAKYAEGSRFTFAETLDNGLSDGFYYWFYLKDFVEPK
jgi:hypothetical protein